MLKFCVHHIFLGWDENNKTSDTRSWPYNLIRRWVMTKQQLLNMRSLANITYAWSSNMFTISTVWYRLSIIMREFIHRITAIKLLPHVMTIRFTQWMNTTYYMAMQFKNHIFILSQCWKYYMQLFISHLIARITNGSREVASVIFN